MRNKSSAKSKEQYFWKAKDNETDIDRLNRMKALEAQLIKKKKLHSVILPDGCVITATKERLAYMLEAYNHQSKTR